VLRAERHEDLVIRRNTGMSSENYGTTFAKVEKVAIGVPYVLVREAERKYIGPLVKVKRRVESRGYEPLADVQTVHVKDGGGEERVASVAILEGVYPPCVAAKNVVDGVWSEGGPGE
jgi:hypothetical protein